VRPEDLERQLIGFLNRGYTPVTFRELARHDGQARRRLAITFDDAFASVYDAAPLLDRVGAPATVFVPTTYVTHATSLAWPTNDRWCDTPWEDELRPMSWAQLTDLSRRGWEVGSHTRSHLHLTTLSDDELAEELAGSRQECAERSGAPCDTLAYPYGDYDLRVSAAARRAGYLRTASVPSRLSDRHPHGSSLEFPRVGVYRDASPRILRLRSARVTRTLRGFPC
jgi:peptidoglycan/xylan/chitin deacetylase (PgdA/CDA1 family)